MNSMAGSGPGYKHKVIITPYMHILVFHIPLMMQDHGNIKQFSGQGKNISKITASNHLVSVREVISLTSVKYIYMFKIFTYAL